MIKHSVEYSSERQSFLLQPNSVSVKFATRSCNYAAHEIAKFGRYRDPEHPAVWMDPLPDFVNLALACDLAEPGVNI